MKLHHWWKYYLQNSLNQKVGLIAEVFWIRKWQIVNRTLKMDFR